MTDKPIQCGEPFVPVLMVVLQREGTGRLLTSDSCSPVAYVPDAADLKAALQSLTPEERAEVVGSEVDDAWQSVSSERAGRIEAEDKLHAAIARAEAAERERDGAHLAALALTRILGPDDSVKPWEWGRIVTEVRAGDFSETRALEKVERYEERINDIANALGDETEWSSANDRGANAVELAASLRSDLALVTKERDEARETAMGTTRQFQALADAARCFKSLWAEGPWGAALQELFFAVDALTAPAAPKSAAELAAEHGFAPHGLPLDVALRGHGSADSAAEATKAESPPDPNEREELGRLLRDITAGPSGGSWEQLGESRREDYRRAASAVAEYVRRVDGNRAVPEDTWFRPHYSGDNSKRFWEYIGKQEEPRKSELYSSGVLLQDLEGKVLHWMNNYMKPPPRPAP